MSKIAKAFFSTDQLDLIKQAIVKAEHNTSGEIRVHLEGKCAGEAMPRAVKVFSKLNMHKTKLRNAVLFYLAVEDRKFAICGDSGIHQAVKDEFWESLSSHIQGHFKQGKFAEGLCEAIEKAGEKLKSHFPHKRDDVNELSDEVSIG